MRILAKQVGKDHTFSFKFLKSDIIDVHSMTLLIEDPQLAADMARAYVDGFQTVLIENPYVNVDDSNQEVGNPRYMSAGFDAQLKSIVILKPG